MSASGPLGAFGVARLPRIVFGAGRITELPALAAGYGTHVLLVTGSHSFRDGPAWAPLVAGLEAAGLAWDHLAVAGEPSPHLVDGAVADRRRDPPDVVVGIGGGAALDAAKAIAGLLRSGTSVIDHLEGVGRNLPYPGPATPFVAVPTTAGTGSEATKNAVISGRLPGAAADDPPFKKSFRDDRLVASVAVLDPDLLAGCPPAVIAGDGMDALTQLLEAFTSTGASPFSDAVARSGLAVIGTALPAWHAATFGGAAAGDTATARGAMAWAALCSGIALANAGLGAAHGLVAPLGARSGSTTGGMRALVAAVTRTNLAALTGERPARGRWNATRRRGACWQIRRRPTARAPAKPPATRCSRPSTGLRLCSDPRAGSLRGDGRRVPALVAESRGSSMRSEPGRPHRRRDRGDPGGVALTAGG